MELIITEKPSSAEKIAHAIGDAKPEQKKKKGVKYYELTADGKDITVVSAVGHLYTVAEKDKGGWTYPVFSVEWVPTYTADKDAKYTKKYLDLIKQLAKNADEITIACDFDIEGEVIGYAILKHALGKKDGHRMKFSTVTAEDLTESYQNKMSHIAHGQAQAGVTRHELDWYYGINLSRALTLSVKAAGSFKLLSSGRVQTPALKILADKEKEIKAFEPEPYWEVELHTENLDAKHENGRFWKQPEAQNAQKAVTDTAAVADVQKRKYSQAPPEPFDLTSLQTEAYKSFGMSPKETLQHAQDLYANGYISYPRTSSQQLPKNIGYEKVLTLLSRQKTYKKLAEKLLSVKKLSPNNGKKKDPAHPAIYPTGLEPKNLRKREKRVYDLIVRRFMATFGTPAKRESMKITLESGGEKFRASGTRTVEPGWHEYYGSHLKLKEHELPELTKGDEMPVEEAELHEKETKPPRRYTPSSIIKELEKRGLGTKATRADIVDNLFNRGYVHEKSIKVTEIGLRTVETLEKYVPEIINHDLTAEIEEELEQIRHGDVSPEDVLEHAKTHLTKVLENFKEHEEEIGKELLKAQRDTQHAQTVLGDCPECGEGELQIKKGKYGMFVGCTNYPDCEATYRLPRGGKAKPAGEECSECGYPKASVKQKKRGYRKLCINPDCPTKELTEAAEQRKNQVETGSETCPECSKPLAVRSSAYGEFIGCTGYPKCRHTEELEKREDAED